MRNKLGVLLLIGVSLAVFSTGAFATAIVPSQNAVNPAGTYLVYGTQTSSPAVKIVNINDPASPTTSRTISLTQSVYGAVFTVDGNYALVSINNETIGVLDFSSGSAPSTISEITLPSGAEPRHIAINKDYAFVASNNGYVYVLDVSDTSNIHYEKSINTGYSGLCGVAVKPDGTRLAVSRISSTGYVYVYDLSDLYSGRVVNSSDLVATISGSSLGSSISLSEPSYLYYGEGTYGFSALTSSSQRIFLYVKNHEESSSQADVFILDSDDDDYDLVGKVNLANYNSFSRDFTDGGASDDADPMSGYTGFALSSNRQFGYIAVYNDTDTAQQVYRFDNSILPSVSRSIATNVSSDLVVNSNTYPIDSIAAETNGRTLWFGYSTVGVYTKFNESGSSSSETGFTQNCPSAPSITYPLRDSVVYVTESMSWEGASDPDGDALTYDIDYINADYINSNGWDSYGTTSDTSLSLGSLTAGNSYYVRVRADDGTDNSAFVYAGPFSVTQESDDGLGVDGVWQMIDDFDNHTVDTSSGYANGSDLSATTSLTDIDTDSDNEYSVSNYQSSGSNGYFSGTLNADYTSMDISSYDAIVIDVLGDGSTNTFQIQLVDASSGTEYVWELPSQLSLMSTSWQTMEVSIAGIYAVGSSGTPDFAGIITGYRVKYSSSEATTSGPHYFDNLRAINTQSDSIPGPTVELTVLLQGLYLGEGQSDAAVDIEVRSAADAASATSSTVVGTYSNISLESESTATKKLSYLADGDYFVVIRQIIAGQTYYGSNHLPIMSANAIDLRDDGTPRTLNFSDGSTTVAYGTGALYQDGSTYLMRAGDVNGDNSVNINDFILWSLANGAISGDSNWLIDSDLNGDRVVNINDFLAWTLNNGEEGQIP